MTNCKGAPIKHAQIGQVTHFVVLKDYILNSVTADLSSHRVNVWSRSSLFRTTHWLLLMYEVLRFSELQLKV